MTNAHCLLSKYFGIKNQCSHRLYACCCSSGSNSSEITPEVICGDRISRAVCHLIDLIGWHISNGGGENQNISQSELPVGGNMSYCRLSNLSNSLTTDMERVAGWEIPATLNMKLLLLRVFFCLNFDIWYSWYMTFSMILGFFLAPKRLRDNLKSQIQSHLNILNCCLTITCYGLTIRCYGVTSGKCFRPLRWNFGAFADTHMFDSWWRGHFWERGRMQRERGQ